MHDELKKFLQDQEEAIELESLNDYLDVWKQKIDFLWDTIIEFSTVTQAYTNRQTTDSFFEKLNDLKNIAKSANNQKAEASDPALSGDRDHIFIEIFKQLLSPNYEPPTHPALLQYHLIALWLFYIHLSPAIPIKSISMRHRIDYVMVRVVHQAAIMSVSFYKKGKDSERTRKSMISSSKRKMKDMQEVLEAFYRLKDRDKKKLHAVAREIRSQLEKVKKDPPSIDTIKRYLKEENLI